MLFFSFGGGDMLYILMMLFFTLYMTVHSLYLILFSLIVMVILFFFFFMKNMIFLGILMVLLYLGGLLMLFSYSSMLNGVKVVENLNEVNGMFLIMMFISYLTVKGAYMYWPMLGFGNNGIGMISGFSLYSFNFFFLIIGLVFLMLFLCLSIYFCLEKIY
uniref:NADH dehydrogenase subunit 6 n=1 Tax=Ciona intestinalis TaxID=7719 RepID=Q8HIN9_CIOIN|nr:NADH dehydrogenase subunit 6 [Ciona robusta]